MEREVRCIFCEEEVSVSRVGEHVSRIHVGGSDVWGCGECPFRSPAMDDTVAHCFLLGHQVHRIRQDTTLLTQLLTLLRDLQATFKRGSEQRKWKSKESVESEMAPQEKPFQMDPQDIPFQRQNIGTPASSPITHSPENHSPYSFSPAAESVTEDFYRHPKRARSRNPSYSEEESEAPPETLIPHNPMIVEEEVAKHPKIQCQKCHMKIYGGKRKSEHSEDVFKLKDHVIRHHIGGIKLFGCSACEFQGIVKSLVSSHCESRHDENSAEVIRINEGARTVILGILQDCFPSFANKYDDDKKKQRFLRSF